MAIFGALRQSGHQAGAGAGNQDRAAGWTGTGPGAAIAALAFLVGRRPTTVSSGFQALRQSFGAALAGMLASGGLR